MIARLRVLVGVICAFGVGLVLTVFFTDVAHVYTDQLRKFVNYNGNYVENVENFVGSSSSKDVEKPKSAGRNGTILTTYGGGNSGNAVWEYLSVLAVEHLLPDRHFVPRIPLRVKSKLEEIFQPVDVSVLPDELPDCEDNSSVVIYNSDSIEDIDRVPDETNCVILEKYASRYKDVLSYGLDNIRKKLKFRENDVEAVHKKLAQIRKEFQIPHGVKETFIGVHYRGGDYNFLLLRYFLKELPSYKYYAKAMDYFKRNYDFPIFVFVTSDYRWLRRTLPRLSGNVRSRPFAGSKARDLALLAHCNHSIISYGTFAATAALMASGETVAFDLEVPPDHKGPTLAMEIAKVEEKWMLMKN